MKVNHIWLLLHMFSTSQIKTATLLLAVSVSCVGSLNAQIFLHSYAIVVGITTYASPSWPDLPSGRPDGESVAKRLTAEGYIVTPFYDDRATKHAIMTEFERLSKLVGAEDRVLIFIATHGTNRPTNAGTRGYIVPFGATDYASMISDAELKDGSSLLQAARHQLFIIDACYGGLILTREGGVPADTPNYIAEVSKRVTRDVITAGGAGQTVVDNGPDGHSVFTNALLRGLGGEADLNKDGFITFAELESFLLPLATNAYQTPATGVLPGHAGGEYVFVSPGVRSEPEVQETASAPNSLTLRKGVTDPVEQAKELLTKSRFADAIPLLRSSASGGDIEAQDYLGRVFYNGWGVTRNLNEAKRWFEMAAGGGSAEAKAYLGLMYSRGTTGGIPDYAKARKLYEEAAAVGNTDAMNRLGILYEHGHDATPKNYVKAEDLFLQSAALGNVHAMVNLGSLYERGPGNMPKEYDKAMQWYKKAADTGYSAAMIRVGKLYDDGLGVEESDTIAAEWYQKAAAAGDSNAMVILAKAEPDYDKSVQWWKRAASLGNTTAIDHFN
jgi:TPR repeat protein